jgi:2-oxoisovalerate dehydrogenase E1 component alpha subunit
MKFVTPDAHPAIPTYRVMDSDGRIVDTSRGPPDVSDEEVLQWYKNMVVGMTLRHWAITTALTCALQ